MLSKVINQNRWDSTLFCFSIMFGVIDSIIYLKTFDHTYLLMTVFNMIMLLLAVIGLVKTYEQVQEELFKNNT